MPQRVGPTLGVWIGLPITILALLIGLVLIVGALYCIFNGYNEYDGASLSLGGGVLIVLATAIIAGICYWPWDGSFHSVYRVHGTVTQVASRQISDGKGMSTRYVFVIDGQPYGVDDTRAALTRVGDTVTLKCTKEYVYQSVPGWACNWDE